MAEPTHTHKARRSGAPDVERGRPLYDPPRRPYLLAAARRVRTTFPGAVAHRMGAASGSDPWSFSRGAHLVLWVQGE